jgi:hypothetical protein
MKQRNRLPPQTTTRDHREEGKSRGKKGEIE